MCGIALVRLRKSPEYYAEKYGTGNYGLEKLYLLMEKQHNRGQEGAGITLVDLKAKGGEEYFYRERATGSQAISTIFQNIDSSISSEILIGHLRYSTTGRHGISYTQPLLRRNNYKERSLALAGNFNLTNVDEVFENLIKDGQHPRMYSDTYLMLESVGSQIDKAAHKRADDVFSYLEEVLKKSSDDWDGGYAICGATGNGDCFVFRDPNGIRPAFYYIDDEVVVVASERPVIQTTFNVKCEDIKELECGGSIMITEAGEIGFREIKHSEKKSACSFERIYFSRGGDADIYKERKQLGKELTPTILNVLGNDINDAVLSFIPNTAETAFFGMKEAFNDHLNKEKENAILAHRDYLEPLSIHAILSRTVRTEKITIKDIKLRTFISQENSRNSLAAHVYDVTYGTIRSGVDKLVIIDDSIVRGTTLRKSIIGMLDRLEPKEIIIVSSSPQVRYPDCYGIDMSMMSEFAAFRAAVSLLKKHNKEDVLINTFERAKRALEEGDSTTNYVKDVYSDFTDVEIADEMAQQLTPSGTKAKVTLVFQTLEGLRRACPNHTGDWYFSGEYPTKGGVRYVNQAFVNWYLGKEKR